MPGTRHQDIAASDIVWRDGSEAGVKFAWFRMDEAKASSPAIVLSKFAPGTVVNAHTHDSNYLEYIIEGEQTVGKVTFGVGDVRIVKGGTGYGPIKVGPHGCTVLIVFEDGSRAVMESLPRKKDSAAIG